MSRDPIPENLEWLGSAVEALGVSRRLWRTREGEARDVESFPSRRAVERDLELLFAALYPRRLGGLRGGSDEDAFVGSKLRTALSGFEGQLAAEFGYWAKEARAEFDPDQAASLVRLFAASLGQVRRQVDSDIEAAFLSDPAARSVDEVLICYPGAIACLHHRLAHEFYNLGAPMVARMISEIANERTGIDIHPGATIGAGFFIDHGTGVVIGETAVVGERVRLYQHVTLGAPSAPGELGSARRYIRHPTVEDDVVIYAGATILGPVTIGARSVIGGNVWLLSDVPPDSVVVQPEARQLERRDGHALRDILAEAD
ncbi:serine O-acetyltransferase [Sphingomonas sp. PL-96]|uniref:serine O-acetyltransferase EpsC n=1 Tax=Sphingomonas sp. PL-96 TaxID=2887201 RepID=UPI001E2A5186|nr:serine O-acetyltransferase EpsC [Sphingomonas sp. PL-96]MCC2975180.1 serine O-acetyltransferase [Sphingomonas sp. PL-96]